MHDRRHQRPAARHAFFNPRRPMPQTHRRSCCVYCRATRSRSAASRIASTSVSSAAARRTHRPRPRAQARRPPTCESLRTRAACRRTSARASTSPMPSAMRHRRPAPPPAARASSSVPRFVFVPTASRVARTASSTVRPTPDFARSLENRPDRRPRSCTKSTYVTSSKSAPRCTLPGFGAVTSQTHASVAATPTASRVDLCIVCIVTIRRRHVCTIGSCRRLVCRRVAASSRLGQKSLDDRQRFVRRVFDDPVADVRQPMHFRLRPGLEKSLQAIRPKAPVAHAPDQAASADRRASASSSFDLQAERSARSDRVGRPRGGISRTKPYTARRFAHESYGARYPAATAGSSRVRRASVIRSAARLNKFAPCTASRPTTGMRHARIRQGMYRGGNAPVLNSTIRSSRSRHAQHRAQANRAAPILGDERDALEVQAVRRARTDCRCDRPASRTAAACRSARSPGDPARRSDSASRSASISRRQ